MPRKKAIEEAQTEVEEKSVAGETPASTTEEGTAPDVPDNVESSVAPALEDTPEIVSVTEEDTEMEAFDAAGELNGYVPYDGEIMSDSAGETDMNTAFQEERVQEPDDFPPEPVEEAAGESAEAIPASTPNERAQEDERKTFYGLDFNELDRSLSPEQRQEWNSIYASYRGHSVMTGTVVGVDRHRLRIRDQKTGEMTSHSLNCAIVIPFRVRILIPETEMWTQEEERPGFVLRNLPGAKIDFVIVHVDREAGFAVGSRRLALSSRRYYFSTRPTLCAPGSRVSCDIMVVGPRRCLVSCHGYDIDLTQRELSYSAVPDLRDVYHSGQTLNCIVKGYDRENGRLAISVKETVPNPYDGAEFRHPEHSHRQAVIAGKYGGGVFCNLPDGVTVMCNYSFHYDDADFRIGDRVMLIIQRYDDEKKQVYGKIVAKC